MNAILEPKRNCWKFGEVASSGLLIDAEDYFKAIYDAASQAKHSILMTGWQFNSDTRLLRGNDAAVSHTDTRLLPFLNELCEKNPDLNVYILAWDFLEVYAFEREWLQEKLFNQSKTGRIHFKYDSRHAIWASHHQKMVVVDNTVAFVGGFDLCRQRWGDRRHNMYHQRRKKTGQEYPIPFHDIQSYHTGPIVKDFVDLFKREWHRSTGEELALPDPEPGHRIAFVPTAPIAAERVAISRTQAPTLLPPQGAVAEIRQMYIDGIHAAKTLVYIENQYFSSRAVFKALIERMRKTEMPKLQIIIVLPNMLKSFFEDLALGFTQSRMLRCLKRVAGQTGHSVGIYYSVTLGEKNEEIPKLIHSKLFLIDDRFLSVGSANLANRSMGLDTELNVAWEGDDREITDSIRRIRLDLLCEHTGMPTWCRDRFLTTPNLVEFLDKFTEAKTSALKIHSMTTRFYWLRFILPHGITIDPYQTFVEETVFDWIRKNRAIAKAFLGKRISSWVKFVPEFFARFFLRSGWPSRKV